MNAEQLQQSQKLDSPNEEDRHTRIDDSRVVDRIRDILIGSQMREYEGRLQHLDERLVREAAEARAAVEKRLENLEHVSKDELELLTSRVTAEETERRAAVDKLYHALAETTKAFELKIKNLDEYAREIHDLHRQLLEQWKTLSAEFKEKHERLQAGLKRETEQIRDGMVTREALAGILGDLVLRLKDDSSG
jgi:formate dehydrogenase maturation protein FdhE